MKTRTKNNIITFLAIIVVMAVSVGTMAFVYITRFGTPNSEDNVEPVLSKIIEKINIPEHSNVEVKYKDKQIVFEKTIPQVSNSQVIAFKYTSGVLEAEILQSAVDDNFKNDTIIMLFEAVAEYLNEDKTLVAYALDEDIVKDKTLKKDGYELIVDDEKSMTVFKISVDGKLNMSAKEDSYFLEEQVLSMGDALKDELLYARQDKNNLILEKNISYKDYMVFSIYEKGKLSGRTHRSLMSVISAVMPDGSRDYVKENYPVITHDGVIILDGIILTINRDYEGVSYVTYAKAEEYEEYVRIYIDMNKYSIKGEM